MNLAQLIDAAAVCDRRLDVTLLVAASAEPVVHRPGAPGPTVRRHEAQYSAHRVDRRGIPLPTTSRRVQWKDLFRKALEGGARLTFSELSEACGADRNLSFRSSLHMYVERGHIIAEGISGDRIYRWGKKP